MDLKLQSDVRSLVDTVIWFANRRSIRSPEQVVRKFYSLYKSGFERMRKDDVTVENVQDWQDGTRALLQAVLHYGRNRKDDLMIDEFFDVFLKNDLEKDVQLYFNGGELRERVTVKPKTVWAFCRLGVALLLDRGQGYVPRKLYMCDAPLRRGVCGKFRISWDTGAGRPEKYCSKRCRLAGTRHVATEAQRARRHNERRCASTKTNVGM